jgi:hypothetical protein
MEWEHERRLVLFIGPEWAGWFCARCCWNRRQPTDLKENETLAKRINRDFEAHDCEQFARENWKSAGALSSS